VRLLESTAKMNPVPEIMVAASSAQARCLDYYWPADAVGSNDLAENNLAVHIAHVCLTRRFAVFAEVDHPGKCIQGIDLLAISEDRTQFIAIEVKRHIRAGMSDSADDVVRLDAFRLNPGLLEERCGSKPLRVLSKCQEGFAVVAGLKWYGGQSAPRLDTDSTAKRIEGLGGEVSSIRVYQYLESAVCGAYWLQYGCFPLRID
jgi:hypothetical protein